MTVSTDLWTQSFVADGIATVFNFNIQAYSSAWILALDESNPAATFAVALNADQEGDAGGTVTFDVAPLINAAVTIYRDVPLTQDVDFPEYGAFPARNNEDALDKLSMALSQFLTANSDHNVIGIFTFLQGLRIANNKGLAFENAANEHAGSGSKRLVLTASNDWVFQQNDGSSWVTVFTVSSAGVPHFPVTVTAAITPVDGFDLTNKAYVDNVASLYVLKSGDAMSGQLTTIPPVGNTHAANKGYVDTNDLLRILKSGDVMTGQLTTIFPELGGHAANRQFVLDAIEALAGGLVYAGTWDASGGLLPPDIIAGTLYKISVAGTLNVSAGGAAPTPTAVAVADTIIYNGSSSWWDWLPASGGDAINIGYNNAGTDFSGTNVQDVLNEVDSRLNALFPVGSVVLRMDDINPSAIYVGTWELISGAAELAFGDGTVQAGSVVGGNTETLITDNLPAHTHSAGSLVHAHTHKAGSLAANGGGSHNHKLPVQTGATNDYTAMAGNQALRWKQSLISTALIGSVGNHTHSIGGTSSGANTSAVTGATASVGAGSAFNVRSARILINVWKRIA